MRDETGRLVRHHLDRAGVDGEVTDARAMSHNGYNDLYRVTFTARPPLMLKVAPPADLPCLRYETDLLRGEAVYYRAVGPSGAGPMPTVLHQDDAGAAPGAQGGTPPGAQGRAFLLMSVLPGESWASLADEVEERERRALRTRLGGIVARAHTVTGPAFGYPAESVAPLDASWRQAFTAMTRALVADAQRFGPRLPRPLPDIEALMAAGSWALEEVTVPVAVHFDLWEGNVLLQGAPGARRVSGIVDGERMFWGDPLADLPSLRLFDRAEDDPHFTAGYRAAGGTIPDDEAARTRLALYRCYLYLIMLTETVPRRFTPLEAARTRTLVYPALEAALNVLAAPSGGGA
ncbi:phosphotransferase family protein [Streptantibioticus silvisoli]|uniref:Aminoglycoside phosphotransferase family protein n=1 Tax=Streptantibioticus silvisoli TaxID=2705255 RepID=A0ABT6VV62_9ACTN|nr:aminoglycoside phosphotransferase family protein [Streptantibioticus silvisoli]MDI5962360.1 aminoglycoside phosphotransferase family protein [Streptantibioticus silvisoli]